MLQFVFLYMGIPAMATAITFAKPEYHDAACMLWLLISVLYLGQYGTIYALMGGAVAGYHLYYAVQDWKPLLKKYIRKDR